VALLSLVTIGGTAGQLAQAQQSAAYAQYQDARANYGQRARPSYQGYRSASADMGRTGPTQLEQLPPGQYESMPHGQYDDGSYIVDDDGGGMMWDDYGSGPAYGDGCCNDYGNPWVPTDGFFGQPGQFFIGGEWLYVRASPSQATSYVEFNEADLENAFDKFHQLDFRHESAFRFYGGYRLCDCGEEIRWTYSQYNSNAFTNVPSSTNDVVILVPFEVVEDPENNGGTIASGDIELRSGDLEYAKTIPLGGPLCCDDSCGDPCGCGDPCACACPTWDITWSGGVRFASADLQRSYATFGSTQSVLTQATSRTSFDGGGPRFGLEGRRYFGTKGMFSAYLKGNISVLLGNVNNVIQRTSVEEPGQVISQRFRNRNVIPVTEIETGLSCCLTKHLDLSAGYFFSAWHDLGFRDEYNAFPTNLDTSYDDANILGFDGLFLRVEAGF
jgi:hypothetical protein